MQSKLPIHVIITFLGILLFLPFLGQHSLFDWDEVNFAESAREMLVAQNYRQVQIGFEAFWEKPPLFIWMQALCMKIFGINEFAARLPNAICGIFTLNLLYYFGRKIRNHFTGIFWVLAYGGSLAPFIYFRSGIIDPVFNLFIFIAIYQLFKSEQLRTANENPRLNMLLAGLFAGLAVLTKGPVAILIIGLVWTSRLVLNYRFVWNGFLNFSLAVFACFLVASLWFVPELISNGPWFFKEFFQYQITLVKGQIEWHNQPWFYHILVLLFLCFPASVFALPHLFKNTDYSGTDRIWSSYMRSTFWIVLIIFSIVSTKIIHYSSLCWFPLSWFGANTVYRWYTNRGVMPVWIKIPAILVSLVLGLALTIVPLLFANAAVQKLAFSKISDPSFKEIVTQNNAWNGIEMLIGIAFIVAALYVIFSMRKNKTGLHPAWLFVVVLVASVSISAIYIPKAAKSLQGSYVSEMKKLQQQDVFVDAWGFKTYAIYFYTQQNKSNFKGEWLSKTADFKEHPNPKTQARLFYLMNLKTSKPVFIVTRFRYTPDWYFNGKFEKVKNMGAYILWKRKDINKPDIRLQ